MVEPSGAGSRGLDRSAVGNELDPLDNPVWDSLLHRHADLSEGGALARRYAPDVHVFAAIDAPAPEAHAALAALIAPGQSAYLLRRDEIDLPAGFSVALRRPAVQMISIAPPPSASGLDELFALSEADAQEMLALAELTKPGPFAIRTHRMGRFIGVRREGRLVAMAGERLRPRGFTEVSGVCAHPDVRGQGLARRLTALVVEQILARGETPFLHTWADNAPAIALYRTLGFELRAEMKVLVVKREAAPKPARE